MGTCAGAGDAARRCCLGVQSFNPEARDGHEDFIIFVTFACFVVEFLNFDLIEFTQPLCVLQRAI